MEPLCKKNQENFSIFSFLGKPARLPCLLCLDDGVGDFAEGISCQA